MKQLANKVAIITGASSGIGRATAKIFAEQGARLVVAARRQPQLEVLVDEISDMGGEVIAVSGDVKDEVFHATLVETALSRFRQLDIAFNNAGILGELAGTTELSLTDWENTLATNLTSAFLAAKYQLPAMLKQQSASLIFTSSFVGHTVGMPQMAAYATSKAGLIGLTKVLAAEYGSKGIRVNALLPGGTDTAMNKEFSDSPETLEFVKNLHALKRIASPDEIAHSALYLASDASSFTAGIALLVDGGVSISRT